MVKDNRTNPWKVAIVSSVLTFSFISIVVLCLFQFVISPSILQYTSYADALVIKDPVKMNNPYFLKYIGKLVIDGSLLSVEKVWSLQSGFYQTVITFLIAINGVLAAFAFIFIKNSSHDKAIEAAIDHTEEYIASNSFGERVSLEAEYVLDEIQADYDSTVKFVDESEKRIEKQDEIIEELTNDVAELKRYISAISTKISSSDTDEGEGGDSTLSIKE